MRKSVPDGGYGRADFALRIKDRECEPYFRPGDIVYLERVGALSDGDVALLFDGRSAVIRQYCEDWAGNACLLTLNRAMAERDIILPASEGRPVCCFGRVIMEEYPPMPER